MQVRQLREGFPAAAEDSCELLNTRSVQQLDELVASQLDGAKDLAQEARADDFTLVHGNHCRAAIRMLEKMVAAFDPGHLEPGLAQGPHHLKAGRAGQTAHAATEIR